MSSIRILREHDLDFFPAYCRYVRTVFPRAGFERWIEWGEWDDSYCAFALFEGERIVANAALTRMRLLVDGAECRAWQFGAVGVVPECRGRGYADQVMAAALAACGDDPVLLFANSEVTRFYPRFGFRPQPETIFGVDFACAPATAAPVVDPAQPATRALIRELASAMPVTLRFGARGHGRIISWYLANGFAAAPRQVDGDSLVLCHIDGDCLHIDDILARRPFDLVARIPSLIDRPIRRIRFGFTPDVWWPDAPSIEVDHDAHLFVRGIQPQLPHRFPRFAQT
ncbi:MAG TPA: GNAT family N-acetyltransferase [Xanthomonadales bacterium]|nr:GNAT family N-acetyltransferase [Xanthomonadales bacterium]